MTTHYFQKSTEKHFPNMMHGWNCYANDNPRELYAALRLDWLDIYKAFWMKEFKDPTPYWKDPGFIALAEKIEHQGRLIEVKFTAGDAFEKYDNNHWLPDECFLSLPKRKGK